MFYYENDIIRDIGVSLVLPDGSAGSGWRDGLYDNDIKKSGFGKEYGSVGRRREGTAGGTGDLVGPTGTLSVAGWFWGSRDGIVRL